MTPAPEAKPGRDSPLVDACFALYQEKRFGEVVSVGEETLAKLGVEWPASVSHETAALWSVVGLAKQALGDDDGARSALESAIHAAPEVERATYRRHLATLALDSAPGRLPAQAIVSMRGGRGPEALESLRRAEEVLAAIPAEALPPARRDEVDQRLWWGYAELGSRRLDAGAYEEALDPLLHALRFDSIGPERRGETRAAVVRALEGIAAVRALSIRRLADADCRDEAALGAEQLRGLLRKCVELGVTEGELWAAYTRIQRLCEEL